MISGTREIPCSSRLTTSKISLLLCLLFLPLLSNCSTAIKNLVPSQTIQTIYSSPAPPELEPIHSPAFVIKEPHKTYNLIGSPSVRTTDEVFVDSSKPAIYYESQTFTTQKGSYTNLVYRIHFEKVPFSFSEPHLTTGNNPGILVIYTLNEAQELLLVSTLGSCGCYLAFLPTDNLTQEAYPKKWPKTSQDVYGYTLPGLLALSALPHTNQITFTLESGSHRVGAVSVEDYSENGNNTVTSMKLQPMSMLYSLPFGDTSVSFFELEGARKGYVKNNLKILERLLISWWAFDLRVGEDKAYGKDDKSGIPLYTSLKFWQRDASDLKHFSRFLSYWGWNF